MKLTKQYLIKLIKEELNLFDAKKMVSRFIKGINKQQFFKSIGGVDIIDGIVSPKKGDMYIYTAIGEEISRDSGFAKWYDSLSTDEQDDINDLIVDELAEQFNMEW